MVAHGRCAGRSPRSRCSVASKMADGLCTEDTVANVLDKSRVKNYGNLVKCVSNVHHDGSCASVKSFYIDSDSGKLCGKLCTKHEEFLCSTPDDDCRKKRCADRYDSSESSDSGVAVLSCTDCSTYSGGSTASSDITDPGSPFSTASTHSEDSSSQPQQQQQQPPPSMAPHLGAHHPPWPWAPAPDGPPLKRPAAPATDKPPLAPKRPRLDHPKRKAAEPTSSNTNTTSAAAAKQGKITAYFKEQMKATTVTKKQDLTSLSYTVLEEYKKIAVKKQMTTRKLLANARPKSLATKSATAKVMAPKIVAAKGVTPKTLPSKPLTAKPATPKTLAPKPATPKTIPPKPATPKTLTPKPLSSKTVSPKLLTSKPLSPKSLSPKTLSSKPLSSKPLSPKSLSPKPLSSKPLSPKPVSSKPLSPKPLSSKPLSPKPVSLKPVSPKSLSPKPVPSKPLSPKPVAAVSTGAASPGCKLQPELVVAAKAPALKKQPKPAAAAVPVVVSVAPDTSSETGTAADSDSGVSVREVLTVSVPALGLSATEPQKSPILSQPKTIRFPAKQTSPDDAHKERRRSDPADSGLCRWSECQAQFDTSGALLEHLQIKHVISQATQEQYVCLWVGCKVHGRTSCSRSWLERHVLSHAGNKPFRCIVDGCGCRFSSQQTLERHVNSHFNASENGSSGSTKKSLEPGAAKLFKRNGKKLRYRRQPWSARMFDFFDAGIMEGLQHRLVTMTERRTMGDICNSPGDTVTVQSRVVARRVEPDGTRKVLLRWYPPDIVPDEWTLESECTQSRTVSIPTLEPSAVAAVGEALFGAKGGARRQRHRRKRDPKNS